MTKSIEHDHKMGLSTTIISLFGYQQFTTHVQCIAQESLWFKDPEYLYRTLLLKILKIQI